MKKFNQLPFQTKVLRDEASLVAETVRWLELNGWTVYQEVEMFDGGRCDIVAVRPNVDAGRDDVWAIEAKMSFGLAVIEQAHRHRSGASHTSVVVPARSGMGFGVLVCKMLGVGVLRFDPSGCRMAVLNVPETRTSWKHPVLNDHMKSNVGGTRGGHWTPFKQTCALLRDYTAANPGVELPKAVREISHHYSSNSGAVAQIRKLFMRNAIPGLRLEFDKLFIEPEVS